MFYKKSILIFFWIYLSSHIFTMNTETKTNISEIFIKNLGNSINTSFDEYNPIITNKDGILFFQSNRSDALPSHFKRSFNIWVTENTHTLQKLPEFKTIFSVSPEINTSNFEGHASVKYNLDGSIEMYFVRYTKSNNIIKGKTDIFYSMKKVGSHIWEEPKPIDEINTPFDDRMPSISSDGSTLYFSSNRNDGFGEDDIWMSQYNDTKKKWSPPINLGAEINSEFSEICPSIHHNTVNLYFSSNKPTGIGGYDIYMSQKKEHIDKNIIWQNSIHLTKPINSIDDDEFPSVSEFGDFMLFSSNRKGGYGGFDIYLSRIPDIYQPQVFISYQGYILDKDFQSGLNAHISIYSYKTRTTRNISSMLPSGSFQITLENKDIYDIQVHKPGYLPIKERLDLQKDFFALPNQKGKLAKVLEKKYYLEKGFIKEDVLNLAIYFTDINKKLIEPRKIEYKIFPIDRSLTTNSNNIFQIHYQKPIHIDTSFYFVATIKGFGEFKKIIPLSKLLKWKKGLDILKLYYTIPFQLKIKKLPKQSDFTLYFETDKDVILPKFVPILQQAVDIIKNRSIKKIVINGHTDSIGAERYNENLSERRALSVQNYFLSHGISEDSILINWYGEQKPSVKELTDEDRLKNRRVEVYFFR